MDRSTTGWGLILSVLCVAVVAYRNDLSSSSPRHGCVWSTMEPNGKESAALPSSSSASPSGILAALNPPSPGVSLNCNLRTLNMDFWNYTFNREEIDKSKKVRIKCSEKLLFASMLSPNQSLFQLRNLQEVQIESCKIRKVPQRVFAGLGKLRTIVIRTQNTEWRATSQGLELEDGALEGLGQLENLDLSQNAMWTLSSGLLCPLRNLVKLNMSYNRLSEIELSSDRCALNVQSVDLSFNLIRRVGGDSFSYMQRITELRLQNNLIEELEDTSFEQLANLRFLNLSSNRLVALPPFIFKGNGALRELYLQNNTISALSPKVFEKLENLLLLDLSHNALTSQWVKDTTFSGLIRLVVMNLSHNQLTFIDSEIFKNLISLQALHLSNNRIETINQEAFQSLSNLHILGLSNNRLSYIDGKIMSRLFVLRQLYLDSNKIRSMDDDAFKNCTSLQDLGLVANAFTEVPVALQSLQNLKTLDIGENKIASVSNTTFTGMKQLIGLRMVDNRIESLPPGFCNSMKKLRVLNFSQNRISQVAATAFTSCPELRVLRLDTNALEELPSLLALPSILWLNVSENRLKWADYRDLSPSLEWLDLSYNLIESLNGPLGPANASISANSNTRSGPIQLRVLDASYNKLKHLDQSSLPSSLETLRLNHNELRSVAPKTFILSPSLRKVELIGNQIETLSLESLQLPQIPPGRQLPEFHLGDNPFLCSCEMEWLSRVNQLTISRQHPRIPDLDKVTCKTTFARSTSISSSGHGLISVSDAKASDFLCKYEQVCLALCHCCEFDACDCAMTCPDGCNCYHSSGWSANIVDCSNNQFDQVPSKMPMDASEIRLDGNRIFELGSHIFIGKKNLRTLFLNDSHVEVIKNKTFNGLKSLEVLHLEENLLTELYDYQLQGLENLRELYLHNNMLRYIAPNTFENLKFLQVLRLDGNQLMDFPVWELTTNGYLTSMMISSNPWSCDCEFLTPFRTWVASKTAIVVDFPLAKCQPVQQSQDPSALIAQPTISSMCNAILNSDITFNNYESGQDEIEMNNRIPAMGGAEQVASAGPAGQESESGMNLTRVEGQVDTAFWTLLLCLSGLVLVIILIVGIFRKEIYYWGTSGSSGSLFCLCCPGKYAGAHCPGKMMGHSGGHLNDEQEKLFDAYFLYCKRDEDMLLQKVVPELEDPITATPTPGQKYRLCLHYRDLCLSPESPWNREMILSACDASKRVVIVLSKAFLESEWSQSCHFRTSIQSAIGLHQKKIVFILLPDFEQGSVSSLSSELTSSMVKNSSVQWADRSFWTKFKKLLPLPQLMSLGGETPITIPTTMGLNLTLDPNCQLPYNLVMNPNARVTNTHHYHQHVPNLLPYQVPPPRNASLTLPPVPKHQILLHHNTIHPTPQHFSAGYSNETFHLPSNHHQNFHHHSNNHNQPIHFSQNLQNHQVLPPHTHTHSHTPSQISNNLSSLCYPHLHAGHNGHSGHPDPNYSSSAVSSCAEFDHVYSTLDSPAEYQAPAIVGMNGGNAGMNGNGNVANSKHTVQHSTSSGVSSGGESSSAVSPSSPIKNGILNKLSAGAGSGNGNGKMYFV